MSAIWDWALAAYDRPGLPQACLALQDEHGQNTAFLLWAAWAGVGDPELLARGADLAARWEAEALGPLRAARRALKAPFPPLDDAARLALREQVKGIELQAERLLMEGLAALAGPGPGGVEPRAALTAASRAWKSLAPDTALAALATALG